MATVTKTDGNSYIIEQIKIALSPVNKYFFWLHTGIHGDAANPDDLMWYYYENGGAEEFRNTHTVRN
jgi:hypothetical protein